jgi:hypothetical protein
MQREEVEPGGEVGSMAAAAAAAAERRSGGADEDDHRCISELRPVLFFFFFLSVFPVYFCSSCLCVHKLLVSTNYQNNPSPN